MDDPKISLNAGDRLVLERGGPRPPVDGQINPAGGEYRIRIFRNGKDAGLATYTDDQNREQPIMLSGDNPTLTLTGNAKDASVEIPSYVGINSADYVPRLNIQTENPPIITGGAFIQARESTQVARVISTPLGVSGLTKNKDNTFVIDAETLTETPQKSLLMKLMQEQSRIPVTIEEGSAGVSFINKNDKGAELLTLDGRQSANDNFERFKQFRKDTKKAADEAWKENDKQKQKDLGTARATPEKRASNKEIKNNLSLEERQEVRAKSDEMIREISSFRNKRYDSAKDIKLGKVPEFDSLLDEAGKIARSFSDGAPTTEKIEKMDAAIDKITEQAEKIPDEKRGFRDKLKQDLKKFKDSYDNLREMNTKLEPKKADKKTGYSPISDDVKKAALAAVDPNIRGQEAQFRPTGSTVAPSTTRNPLSSSTDRTV